MDVFGFDIGSPLDFFTKAGKQLIDSISDDDSGGGTATARDTSGYVLESGRHKPKAMPEIDYSGLKEGTMSTTRARADRSSTTKPVESVDMKELELRWLSRLAIYADLENKTGVK